jgi:hypothetical protein
VPIRATSALAASPARMSRCNITVSSRLIVDPAA